MTKQEKGLALAAAAVLAVGSLGIETDTLMRAFLIALALGLSAIALWGSGPEIAA